MQIRNMFAEDINRPINGVIKVDQDTADVIEQEVREYVITKELKRHFISFFDFYSEAFDKPTDDIGVWISGFFGSGKSHFLKMLSYILENKPVADSTTVEMFRKKFEDDPATFMMIDRSTRGKTETILFNVDVEGSINKDKTAVLRVFAKMFYNHLGFYGDNLKLAMLEQYIDQLGKTEEFRRVFEEKKGKSWVSQRKAFAFNGKIIIPTLMQVLDMSEEDAKRWFSDKSAVEFSIAQLVEDIKAYVRKKPKDFRLLFMIDEVGQYVGTDTDMLLNLQSLTEKIGSECGGKVWVVCTGQEAIDEIIKVRADEFSRIQARFKTRLSLSSSSVDEVIQKRILKKTPKAEQRLEGLYAENDSVLRNLFTFRDALRDIKGFGGPSEFSDNYPFVPYQFIIMQKVFAEIRKHGNSGKHLSGGERSMLSGFQEAAQALQEKEEYTLVPFYRFYDTVHSFLDSSIRRVIERCQKAADAGDGLEQIDVSVLKLLYLIRYIDKDIPANLDNIVILMADDIRTDKILLRSRMRESLDRLNSQNYIGRTGEVYNFLTDEEQDVAREIRNTIVDSSALVEQIKRLIFTDIYTSKKFKYGKYDFDFDKMVDGSIYGSMTGGMALEFLTMATDALDKNELRLMTESRQKAIVLLAETSYYEALENAAKIRRYVMQRNVAQLPKTMQDIIRGQQEEAGRYEKSAMEDLRKAIEKAEFYVHGEHLEIRSGDARSRIDQAMKFLVENVYDKLNLIEKNADTDADIIAILTRSDNIMEGMEPNRGAAATMEQFLTIQQRTHKTTSMYDIQTKYQGIPFGWREIDIAAAAALLIRQQKVTIKYGGATIQPGDKKLPDMLRKKSEIGKTIISIRVSVNAIKIRQIRSFLTEYLDVMDVPSDEDGLVNFIISRFTELKDHYEALNRRYDQGKEYPDRKRVRDALQLITDVLSQQKDNLALIDRILKKQDDLFDSKEDMQQVEDFFKNQVQIFDAAVDMDRRLRDEREYLSKIPEIEEALKEIRRITGVRHNFRYNEIPQLHELMNTVRTGHDNLLADKKSEIRAFITQCLGIIHVQAKDNPDCKRVAEASDRYFDMKKEELDNCRNLALIDAMILQLTQRKDMDLAKIKAILEPEDKHSKHRVIKTQNRLLLFQSQILSSEDEIDDYLNSVRSSLKRMLKDCDGIKLT